MLRNQFDRRTVLAAGALSALAPAAAKAQSAKTEGQAATKKAVPKIALEEHIIFPDFVEYLAETKQNIRSDLFDKVVPILEDFGDRRLEAMDRNGIAYSVLSISGPGVQIEPDHAKAAKLAKSANDRLAAQVQKQPKRYGGFAHLALQDPAGAADELERCMTDLGFQGALINGETNGEYLDHRRFDVFWERAAALKAPIYIHPGNPAGKSAAYAGHPELWGPTWSWAAETCTHALRLVFSGVFDRFPDARVILGHMGETLPMQPWRLDSRYPISNTAFEIEKKPSEYLRNNLWLTTSGVCDDVALRCALDNIGGDRVLFSVDYPFEKPEIAAKWIDNAEISEDERFAVSQGNAAKLMNISL
ncbi:amidohydrolase family protein [Thioclava sp. GXIMD2076]|uniref:Amidohydrolase family protein n=1 Tax=Thioclava kandeliae TaxID=3070818 RepID=A0ABV1SME1_9RHOB